MSSLPDQPRLIKIAKKVFRYDEVLTTSGWKHDVYYDRVSQEFLIADFPKKGQTFAMSYPPEDGPCEITTGGVTYKARVYEPPDP